VVQPPGGLELLHVDQSPPTPSSSAKWSAYIRPRAIGADKPTNDPMEATYIGINMWKQAVEKAKSTDTDKVIAMSARPSTHQW
jgi:urea transport system substrate-binding protein